ncbi:MAG: transposase, partial [Planctomycetaceae bacterium]|nr:transposase [Planctomycetaceae bacterium]
MWHVDLTTIPIGSGFWTSWIPFALPQHWPFCWWVAVVMDHFSRRVMGFAVFSDVPTSASLRAFLGRAIGTAGAAPKYVICDQGAQFSCPGFLAWCRQQEIHPRFGAVGQHGSIAVIERFIRTLKTEGTRRFLVPAFRNAFRRELLLFLGWYNEHRPHMPLRGRTPDEVYFLQAASQPPSPLRTTSALATGLPLRSATDTRCRTARREVPPRTPIRRGAAASACRDAPSCCLIDVLHLSTMRIAMPALRASRVDAVRIDNWPPSDRQVAKELCGRETVSRRTPSEIGPGIRRKWEREIRWTTTP